MFNSQCRKLTAGPTKGIEGSINLGEAAHICAASPGGHRYNPSMSSEERASAGNGIWLCRNCATLIDRDEDYYTVPFLYQWKYGAETQANIELISKNEPKVAVPPLDNSDTIIMDDIIKIMELSYTVHMIKEHDFHDDFQREYSNPLFDLLQMMNKPSKSIHNLQKKSNRSCD